MSRVRTKLMQVLKKRLQRSIFWCFTLSLFPGLVEIHGQAVQASQARAPVLVNVQKNLSRLIEEEDTDGDKKLTLDDTYIKGKGRGDKRFWLIATNGKRYEVVGTYYLSNLLQELRLAQDTGSKVAGIDFERIFESPVQRISRSIQEIYWDSLTRSIDKEDLGKRQGIFHKPFCLFLGCQSCPKRVKDRGAHINTASFAFNVVVEKHASLLIPQKLVYEFLTSFGASVSTGRASRLPG